MAEAQNINFLPPTNQDQLQQIMNIQRAQQLAQSLSDNANMPDANAMAGNVVYRHSPLEYLARGASKAIAGQENLNAQNMRMKLLGQQMNPDGGTPPETVNWNQGGNSVISPGTPAQPPTQTANAGYSPSQLRAAALIDMQYPGMGLGAAQLKAQAPTNEQINANASGQPNPLAYANQLAAGAEGAKAPYAAPIPIPDSAGAQHYMTPFAFNQRQPQPAMSPSNGIPNGPSASAPAPVNSAPLPPPPGSPTGMNIPSSQGMPPQAPVNPGMVLPTSALPPPNAPPTPPGTLPAITADGTPPINPAYAKAVAPESGLPPPSSPLGQSAPPIIGVGPSIAQKGALDAQSKLQEDAATNNAEDLKVMNIMKSGLPQQMQRFSQMRNDAQNASAGYGVDQEGDGWKQNMWNALPASKTSAANNDLQQKSAQGVLGELGPQLAQSGARGNKFLETIANQASALKMNAPPQDKVTLVNGLQNAWTQNFKATAARLRAQGIQAPTDEEIDAAAAQYGGGTAPPVATSSGGWSVKRVK